MPSKNDQENCTVCDGEKVSIPSFQDVKEGRNLASTNTMPALQRDW